MQVLIAYATRHGATAGIAERIAERLRTSGLDAVALPVAEVRDAEPYDAFVVGGAAYMYRWLGEATNFVERNSGVLAAKPTWLFSSGPIGTELVDTKGRDVLEKMIPPEFPRLRELVHPRGEKVFFGAYHPVAKPGAVAELVVAEKPAKKSALPIGDFRDWPAIDAWADEIAAALGAPVIPS